MKIENFEFKCPNCSTIISAKDFNENEKILSYLKQIFDQHQNQYIKDLEQQLTQKITNQLASDYKIKVAENEIQFTKANQNQLDQLNQTIANLKAQLVTSEKLHQQDLTLKLQQTDQKNNQTINKITEQYQQEKLDMISTNTKIINEKTDQLNQLNQDLANLKHQLATIEKLHQKDVALKLQTNNEKALQDTMQLNEQIHELKQANLQFKVIQNKTKGENFEHDVEAELRKTFAEDIISKITSQDKKADYLQQVKQDDKVIGRIVYEVKNAEWSNAWETKLVTDMAKQKGKYGIIVATSFNDKYKGIPFKASDTNNNIYLTDAESFYFVGHILRILIKTEYKIELLKQDDINKEKIAAFYNWKDSQLPQVHKVFEDSVKRISESEHIIIKRVDEIRIAREKILNNWVKLVKDYIDNFNF